MLSLVTVILCVVFTCIYANEMRRNHRAGLPLVRVYFNRFFIFGFIGITSLLVFLLQMIS